MAVPRARLLDLLKVQTRIFSQAYNPDGLRTGNSVLRQRLRGPSVAAYYPRRGPGMRELFKAYKAFDHNIEMWDDDEEDRQESLQLKKLRGKSAPRKRKKTKGDRKRKGSKPPPASAPRITF